MPLARHRAVRVRPLDLPGIGDIAGLDDMLAMIGGEFEGGVDLALIMADRAAGLVMADQ